MRSTTHGRLTLRTVFEQYHASVAHAPRTLADVRASLVWWERLTGDPPLERIDRHVLRVFYERARLLHWLQTRAPVSGQTVEKWLRYVSAILHAAEEAELIERVPRMPKRKACPRGPVVYASPGEISRIYESCHVAGWPRYGHAGIEPVRWWQALVVFLFNVGSRRGEWWRSLPCAAVDLERRLLTITNHKGGGSAEVKAINDLLAEHLSRFLRPERALLFPSPNTKRSLYRTWYQIQDQAGIFVARPAGSRRRPYYGFHELRKTCGTMLCAINPRAAQVTLGHKSLKTTLDHYAGVEETIRQAADTLPQPDAFSQAGTPATTFRVVG